VSTVTPRTAAWLEDQADHLVGFAAGSLHPEGGFGWLDDYGRLDLARPVELWVTCRMTHVFGLSAMLGNGRSAALLDHGVTALRGRLRDDAHGGWFASVGADGPTDASKHAYAHAFVLLAAATATAAGHHGGRALLAEAGQVFDTRFWRAQDGLAVDVWDREWQQLEDYRGVNANMHTLEAFLAVHDVTGEGSWLERAEAIATRVVHGFARDHAWRLPEHFSGSWQVRPDYNADEPAHPFRPYGVTVGHLLEWSRLTLNLRTALGADAPDWMLEDAAAMFARAVDDGWSVDGNPGFVYTTDFDGRPVVRHRMHWVVAEAVNAADALGRATGESSYDALAQQWWDYAEAYLVDEDRGSWVHELDPANRPSSTVWVGKPDVYHAYQAALLPLLGEISSFAGGVRNHTRAPSPSTPS
jgi:sulfoquinovose isomerase